MIVIHGRCDDQIEQSFLIMYFNICESESGHLNYLIFNLSCSVLIIIFERENT